MKVQINTFNLLLSAVAILFLVLWINKSPTPIVDTTKEDELKEIIRLQDLQIKKSDSIIDIKNKLISASVENQNKIKKQLEILNTKYNEDITHIDSQFINADITMFRANYISDSTSNKR